MGCEDEDDQRQRHDQPDQPRARRRQMRPAHGDQHDGQRQGGEGSGHLGTYQDGPPISSSAIWPTIGRASSGSMPGVRRRS
jgi:hypothetical protein